MTHQGTYGDDARSAYDGDGEQGARTNAHEGSNHL